MARKKRITPSRDAVTAPAQAGTNSDPLTLIISADDLNDRQRRGLELYQTSQSQNGIVLTITETLTFWFSQKDRSRKYEVERLMRNHDGTVAVEYRCQCQDFIKHGKLDCKHIFAERLRRQEIRITGLSRGRPRAPTKASRRTSRKRYASDGRPIRSAQRAASRKMPERVPELLSSLIAAASRVLPHAQRAAEPPTKGGGRTAAPAVVRAFALVAKVAAGVSASEMIPRFTQLIQQGLLLLKRAPSENTLSKWLNDEALTPVLQGLLRMTSQPFRQIEIGAMVDSSKFSQLMIAHSKEVEYNNLDERPGADWMKAHVLVGVETMIVMAAAFSGTRGQDTHDVKFLEALVDEARETFDLRFLLGDKAYLTAQVPDWLDSRGIQAVIPLRKRWFTDERKMYSVPLKRLIDLFHRNNNRDFHEVYRLRPKIEGLFSILKRLAGGFCWSRGRKRAIDNADSPCTAWINETLCKLIYVNLRLTVSQEETTGVKIDYLIASRRFPPPDNPLLEAA